MKSASFLAILAIATACWAEPALAQATRTWVSGVGDDVNPCSRTAPCKTFAGAISKTAVGGEINCIDAGAFGAVTITKSISIQCEFNQAGVLEAGTNGIIINAPGSIVMLRGLDISGTGTVPGLNGVRVISGGQVHIEKCIIRRFNGASPNGFGIQFVPPAAAELYVSETYISDNGAAGSGGGIQIRPTGATNVSVVLNRVEINNNTFGLGSDGSGSTGSTNITLSTSVVAGNTSNGISSAATPGGSALTMMISGSLLAGNAGAGVNSSGAAASGPGSSLVLI